MGTCGEDTVATGRERGGRREREWKKERGREGESGKER